MKKRMYPVVLRMFAVLMALPLIGFGQEAPTLAQLAERAIEKNRSLAKAGLDIQSERETRKGIREIYLPHVEANGQFAHVNANVLVDLPTATVPVLNIPLFEGSERFRSRGNLWTSDVTASAVLFTGTKAPKMGKALDQKIRAQEIMLEKQRQEIMDQVGTAYDQLALLHQVAHVLEDSRRRLEIERKTAEKAFGYGLITSYELNKLDVAAATLVAGQQEYEGKRRLLLQQLHQLTDVSMDSLALIVHALEPYGLTGTLHSFANRPEVAALDAALEANRYRLQAERTHWIPQVKALARVGYYGLANSSLKTPYALPASGQPIHLGIDRLQAFPSYLVGVGFRWNLFDGMQGKRAVNKARIEVRKAELDRQEAGELLQLDLAKAQTEYELANKQLTTGQARLNTAKNALDIAQKESRVGLIKPAERIAAETDYQQAALDYYQTVFNQRRAAFRLLMATGELTLEKLNGLPHKITDHE